MIEIIKYEPDLHFEIIEEWAKEREIEIFPFFLSPTGFIALKDGVPSMCIFVYHILGVNIIQLDHLLSIKGMNIFQARECWNDLWKVISDYVNILQTRLDCKYLVKAYINPRLQKEIKRSGFDIDKNEVSIARVII